MNKSMTTEKALEILQEIKCDFKNKCCTSIDLGNIEAIDVAISALEKQIPKKPIFKYKAFFSFDGYCCPNCNNYIKSKKDPIRPNHCEKCGQALDWSDSDE